jgi:hypothetical protein
MRNEQRGGHYLLPGRVARPDGTAEVNIPGLAAKAHDCAAFYRALEVS